MKPNFIVVSLVSLALAVTVSAQTKFTAWSANEAVTGNHETRADGILNDFKVTRPITVWSLGAFDSEGDGFTGSGVAVVQLFQQQGKGEKNSLLLETTTFDAASSGELVGGFRFKPLARPVTLLPGIYTITATGFDKPNKEYNFTRDPAEGSHQPTLTLNNGGGLIQFLGCNRFHGSDPTDNSDQAKNIGPADRFAVATFQFSQAQTYASPFAADYAALTAGVTSFPIDSGKSNIYDGTVTLNRYGSIALLNDSAFPVVVEPSGSRLIFEAAGTYNGNPNGARCVMFGHEQWGHAEGDARMVMFENAIKWASRKASPASILVGLSTNLNATYFASRGYQVRYVDPGMKTNDDNTLTGCDVIVADLHGPYTQRFYSRLNEFTANGGSLVATFLPWRYVHGASKPAFARVNTVLQPFGMAYRSSQTLVTDWGFTNLPADAYPPTLFNAFPAAQLLREDRLGQIQLTSLEKAIAMNTISYAADRQAERLAALTAIYSGSVNDGSIPPNIAPGTFTDVLTLAGFQATTNLVGRWIQDGNELVSLDSRGSVEYELNVTTPDVYRLQLVAKQGNPKRMVGTYDFNLTLDGVKLGQRNLDVTPGSSGTVECMTPFITPGIHRLRVIWDNANVRNQLRLQSVHLQSGAGQDGNGNGVKDWVDSLAAYQSGLDLTNEIIASYVSPLCLEGRDPYPALMEAGVSGADQNPPRLTPQPAPNGRWYLNIPLASDGDTTLQVSYQNGLKTEVRQLQWWPVNVLNGGSFTLRKGDSLSLIARPDTSLTKDNGRMQFTFGTNETPSRLASFQFPRAFNDPGTVIVTGTYTATNGATQTGSITVNVVEHTFTNSPDCWVGEDRDWDTRLPAEAQLEADARMFTTPIALLPDGGWRNRVIIDQSESRYFVTRLGTNGPVLSAGAAKGFNFWSGKETYTRVKETLPDGSELVEMMLLLSPVLPDIAIQMDVIVGGVIFEDGTLSKRLTPADFDAQGRCIVRFIRPLSAETSVCHSIKVWQGNALVGSVF